MRHFQGILCLFLLDMGLLVAKNLHHLKSLTWPLALFAHLHANHRRKHWR
ncbi:MAG: sodium-dependent bicarbonate transport family permease [Alphaproteobacteria bacterium]|nr:sodium-dependent bicarbonate transport family permease [Alphaproteobacteria bacterium]